MNEKLNLVEILKDCPTGTKFYTPVWGEVSFRKLLKDKIYVISIDTCSGNAGLTKEGYYLPINDAECIIFPSKEQKDWSKFTAPWYNLEKQGEDKKEINNFDVLPGLYKCIHRMFDGTPDGRLLFEIGKVYKCLSKHDRAEFEVSYGYSIYLEDPVVCKYFIPFESKGEQASSQTNIGKNEQKSSGEIEPKFKVGNWYQCTKNFLGKGVIFDRNTAYYCAQEGCLQDEYGCHIAIVKDLYDRFKLWTIQDAKDGDVLALSLLEDKNLWEKIVIFKKYHSDGVKGLYSMPCVEGYGNTFKNGKLAFNDEAPYYSKTWTCNLHPATKEQRDTLMKVMNDAGYKWDEEKKELNKKEKFDPKTLKPFDKVLVRDDCKSEWQCDLFSHIKYESWMFPYKCVGCVYTYRYCIPYNEETKHVLGTKEEAPEFYRYWED